MHKINKLIVILASMAALATSALAQDIRFLVFKPGKGFFEVITGSNTGGRLINSKYYLAHGFLVQGYTDRAERGELVGTIIFGNGTFSRVGVTINGRPFIEVRNARAPFASIDTVPVRADYDNIVVYAEQGRRVERRLPIGRR